jgi:dihydrolipoamide dehydrogenase
MSTAYHGAARSPHHVDTGPLQDGSPPAVGAWLVLASAPCTLIGRRYQSHLVCVLDPLTPWSHKESMLQASRPARNVDVAVIGAGTAGLAAYRAAIAAGASAVVIEAGEYGTTCARVGCMPSKLLIAAAETAHHARHSQALGVSCEVSIDGRAVMQRLRRERDRFVGFVLESVDRIPDEHKLRGRARFVRPGLLDVDGLQLEARAVVIATGSSPVVPSVFDAVRDRIVINDDVFGWETLPESVAVFGTGVIGLEIGQALHRLGVRVRIFGRGGTVGPLTDPDVKASALAALREELSIDVQDRLREVLPTENGVEVRFLDDHGVARVETFARALIAAGRRPNLGSLNLEAAGVRMDERGIPNYDRATLQCSGSAVFLAGDANHELPLLHVAADEGKTAGENAARYPDVHAGAKRSLLAITFSDPQIAIAGSSYATLVKRGEFVKGEVSFVDQGRSRVMLQNRGLGHLYAEPATGRFLGAELAAPRAEHLGHLLAWAHQAGMTIDQMLAMPFYHPVIEEGLRTALRDVRAKLTHERVTT